jgi:hypothetical protein
MLVLSDEPKALVLAAEKLIETSPNIANLFSVDRLAFQLADYIRELRSKPSDEITFIGTAGFYIFRLNDDGVEEIKVMLDMADFYRYAADDVTQQFIKQEGPMVYDESCPAEWIDEDA